MSALCDVRGERYMQTDAAISRGSSRGGLFDGEGRTVGITPFTVDDAPNLDFAIPVERAMEVAGLPLPAARGPAKGSANAN